MGTLFISVGIQTTCPDAGLNAVSVGVPGNKA